MTYTSLCQCTLNRRGTFTSKDGICFLCRCRVNTKLSWTLVEGENSRRNQESPSGSPSTNVWEEEILKALRD